MRIRKGKEKGLILILALAFIGLHASILHAQTWNIGYPNPDDVRATLFNDTLIISGTGEMQNWTIDSGAAWSNMNWNWNWTINISTVVINNGVTSIGSYAFWHLSGVTSICIGNSVTSTSNSALDGCSNLTFIDVVSDNPAYSSKNGVLFNKNKTILIQYPAGKIGAYTIPHSVTSIGDDAFSNCKRMTSITIPHSVTSIGNSAFFNCSSLMSVTIGNSVTSIGNSAFFYCSRLMSVTIPHSVTSIGNSAFFECRKLASVTIPKSVTSIGRGTFYRCHSLRTICIPKSVTSIGKMAFYECKKLTSVAIPKSVTSIGEGTFYGCHSLRTINVASNNSAYSSSRGVLFDKNKTSLIQCPEVKSGTYTIPKSVATIRECAFAGCEKLTSVTIPNFVTTIGDYVFDGCYDLTTIISYATTPPTINKTFDDILNHLKIYVPCESLPAYQSAPYWKDLTYGACYQ